jgi:hypothetical protein
MRFTEIAANERTEHKGKMRHSVRAVIDVSCQTISSSGTANYTEHANSFLTICKLDNFKKQQHCIMLNKICRDCYSVH